MNKSNSRVVCAAIYTFCAHYHSGQWSRGYRLLCRTGRAWQRRTGLRPRLDYWETLVSDPRHVDSDVAVIYRKLIENHANHI